MRGLFVTGTDTGVGKSVLAAAVCAGLAARGERVAAFKPVVTGLDSEPGEWPRDHELLAAAANAGQSPDEVSPWRFAAPASPHLAAELEGVRVEPASVRGAARRASARAETLVVEGAGGLMAPLASDYLVRDLAVDLGFPLLVAARTGLGTINHTLLTVEAARAAGLRVAGIVLTPWGPRPSVLEASNRETVERLTGASIAGLPVTTPATLPEAAAALPLREWLDVKAQAREPVAA